MRLPTPEYPDNATNHQPDTSDYIDCNDVVPKTDANLPPVGSIRLRIVDRDEPKCINPEIEYLSDETVELYEGCLSFPGHNGAITRSKKVKVKAQDRNGNWFELEAENMLARCIQHENDHLNGVTIMDRATHFYEDDYPEDAED